MNRIYRIKLSQKSSSRTYYNGIEKGKREITEQYLKQLASFYRLTLDEVAVYNDEDDIAYNKMLGNMLDLVSDDYESLRSHAVLLDTSIFNGQQNRNVLSAVLRGLGYELKIKPSQEMWRKYFVLTETPEGRCYDLPRPIMELLSLQYVICLIRGGEIVAFFTIHEYLYYENMVINLMKGHVDRRANYLKQFTMTEDTLTEKETPLVHFKNELNRIQTILDNCSESIAERSQS